MGRSFSAKRDGIDAPYRGRDEFNSVSIKMVDAHTLEESDKKNGVVVKINRWSVDPDGIERHSTVVRCKISRKSKMAAPAHALALIASWTALIFQRIDAKANVFLLWRKSMNSKACP
jgi:hypothetical protein